MGESRITTKEGENFTLSIGISAMSNGTYSWGVYREWGREPLVRSIADSYSAAMRDAHMWIQSRIRYSQT